MLKLRRHNTDYCVRIALQHNRLFQQIAVTAKALLPEPIAKNHCSLIAALILFGEERATQHRLDTEHFEEVAGHGGARETFWRAVRACQKLVVTSERSHAFKRLALLPPIV